MQMEIGEFADLLLKKYSDRSKLPDDEAQLMALIFLCDKTTQQLREENAALKRLLPHNNIRSKSKKNTKDKINKF